MKITGDKPVQAAATDPWTHAARMPDKPAVIMIDTGESLSYRDMIERANRFANYLVALGLKVSDTIAILAENSIRYPELLWAAKSCGLHYVCISSRLKAAEAGYIVENSGAAVLVASQAQLASALQILDERPAVHGLVLGSDATGRMHEYETAVAAYGAEPVTDRPRGNSMLYSSGTTGKPKGVRAPIQNVSPKEPPVRYASMVSNYDMADDCVFLAPGPLYHVASQRTMMATHRAGGTALLAENFDAQDCLNAIARHRATHGIFVPTMFVRMLELPAEVRASTDLSSMRFAVHGAAPCPLPVKEAMLTWWGPVIYEVYGSTEGIGNTFIGPHEWMRHRGSIGKPPPGCEVRVLDDEGRQCAPGVPGLIYLKNGRGFEYHNDPAKTEQAYRDGWATLGDIGYLDDDGYLYLTDRQSDVIISGGVNIYPKEAENVMAGHHLVGDVAVIGIPHDDFGEAAHAVVVLKPDAAPTPELASELLAYCRAQLSSIKCPKTLEFADDLPRTDTGKILKRELKARVAVNPHTQGVTA